MQQPHSAPLLTADAVARLLGVDASTVYRMAGDGRLPALKVGRQWRFPAEDLASALRAGVPTAMTEPAAAAARVGATRDPWPDAALVAAVVAPVAAALDVTMVVTDLAGRPVTELLHPCPRLADHDRDPGLRAACAAEWSALGAELDFEPRFRTGALGFACARALVRRGDRLIGMVLAGGVAPGSGTADDGLHHLDANGRARVLRALPLVAAALSRLAGPSGPAPSALGPYPQGGS